MASGAAGAERPGLRDQPDPEEALHGRPTMMELLEAAREFLAQEVLPATEGRVNFHSRVTIRVLDTVIRQLRLGRQQAIEHVARLEALGYASDHDLITAIRAGEYDERIGQLADALEPDVRAKLEVADPRYID
jgi:nucleotide-binding universal stress UspA family protein